VACFTVASLVCWGASSDHGVCPLRVALAWCAAGLGGPVLAACSGFSTGARAGAVCSASLLPLVGAHLATATAGAVALSPSRTTEKSAETAGMLLVPLVAGLSLLSLLRLYLMHAQVSSTPATGALASTADVPDGVPLLFVGREGGPREPSADALLVPAYDEGGAGEPEDAHQEEKRHDDAPEATTVGPDQRGSLRESVANCLAWSWMACVAVALLTSSERNVLVSGGLSVVVDRGAQNDSSLTVVPQRTPSRQLADSACWFVETDDMRQAGVELLDGGTPATLSASSFVVPLAAEAADHDSRVEVELPIRCVPWSVCPVASEPLKLYSGPHAEQLCYSCNDASLDEGGGRIFIVYLVVGVVVSFGICALRCSGAL